MGQYYRAILKKDNSTLIYSEDHFLKITEHCYFGCYLVDFIASQLYKHKCKLCWCGDYANDEDILQTCLKVDDVFLPNVKQEVGFDYRKNLTKFKKVKFDYSNKFFVNHTKKEYIDFDKYLKNNHKDEWGFCLSPIGLMVAVGNGRGCGDYYGVNGDKVGSWFFDDLSIEDNKPVGYSELNVLFYNEYMLRCKPQNLSEKTLF